MTDQQKFQSFDVKVNTDNKCDLCEGSKCCNYVTQAIDTPRSVDEFDTLLWQMTHKGVQCYKDEDGWFLLFYTTCQYLQDSGRCGIYETRPQMCRDYSNDYCEYDSPAEEGFDLFFETYGDLDKYCKKRFKKWGSRFTSD